jgi:hypothetical protein
MLMHALTYADVWYRYSNPQLHGARLVLTYSSVY